MRMLLKAVMDTKASNRAMRDGDLKKVINKIQARIKPEATYYTATCGRRSVLFFFECKESSSILVELAEPLFSSFEAEVSMQPVMNDADLEKGFEAWSKSSH